MEPKARLLFVDDEERVVNLLRTMFRSEYEVYTATSGREALEIVSAQPIDVIVSDQRMPEMVGIELLSEVRKRSPATMRILLTGYADLTAIIGSVNEGEVFRFITKPWDHGEIKRIIAEAAQIAQATTVEATQAVEPDVAPAVAAPASQAQRPEVLLLDDSQSDRQAMAQIIGTAYKVHGAANIAETLKILEQHDIGVIVAEAHVGGSETKQLLRILKQHYPSITTVMMTHLADAEVVIRLINEAQVYRVATKPIRSGVFQMIVTAAMKEHMRFISKPELAKRHAVAPSAEPENASLAASVVKSLAGLRLRLSRLMH
jgi:response regulator RpfG family c-di-GMP phosphodiesterase